jgi:hypothetical protein
MSSRPEHELIHELFQGLRSTFLEGQLILGGSSGLFAFPTAAPAFTEDLDFLVHEDLVVARGSEIVKLLSDLGFRRAPETPTFTAPGRPTFDLVGYSTTLFTDHLSPAGPLQVMVFGDLGVVLSEPGSVARGPTGVLALSPAGFCAVKLLTVRVEKGSKDKLQALLVIAEQAADREFRAKLFQILDRFGVDRLQDALADAQVAFLSCQKDPGFRDHGAEAYAAFLENLEAGYRALVEILRVRSHE